MTTAAIYLRLSNDDGRQGESLSIEGQRQDCSAYAERQGWSVVEFEDDGFSASKDIRASIADSVAHAARDRLNPGWHDVDDLEDLPDCWA